ncbi:motile sperm domain-containing protein 2-like [Cotesia glomerata]|uniref:Motile sperm domain-containing protein 2 n=1 Tax=Cotesia glomerata TaxID=32391 RepID=A0AAV7HDE8_COTGL|nr:motile sperm domain-containing protein 2-like [Cotesia glomerata]XP_044586965.1 motile sperm domain-containing protein 2-like [Cotesia glomerata]XP_044586967.1 motile sperm domain-containing protein 2-like [Cotesia glomerata]XP_044586968.1 motile sperm domain-containing protein 2-like [Cotesia glomerata]XP_044586969.1 motile sperm domain-containing protein 2-like [Cotesia glomerata]KAH0535199.1 hypothetical protein KQX54_014839 [Cotesia glomerata]
MELQQQISELREKLLKKLEDEGNNFHPDDIVRVKTRDDWLRRFIEHSEFKVDDALNMLWNSCEWRQKVGANDINEENVRREYLEDGVFFGYGKDKDGKTLFVIRSKLHVRGARDFEELQRCVIYWLERLEREGNGDQITLFFDMTDTGLSNTDLEFIKYIINLLKHYYPNFLNNIILLDLPWVLNAALKIIKSWLPPPAIPKIKQVNKTGLKDLIDSNVALKSWGGTNEYVFKFIPEVRTNSLIVNGKLDNKKVHFAENSPLTEMPSSGFGDQSPEESMLAISPDVISFNKEGPEIIGTIVLKNTTTEKFLSYKIKTTAPEKFRVRRSTGVLAPGMQATVTVSLQPGFNLRALLHQDKFLVMCLPLKDSKMSSEDLTEFWKTNGKSAEQHKVFCRDGMNESASALSSSLTNTDRTTDSLHAKIAHLEECHGKLHKELRNVKHVMIISIIWTVVAAVAIVYILRSDIEQVLGNDQSCHTHSHI